MTVEGPLDALLCRACGTRNHALGGGGLLVVIELTDLTELAALFRGALDVLRCENPACNRPLPATPTVGVVSVWDREAVVVPGTLAGAGEPGLFEPLRAELEAGGIALEIAESLDRVRGWVVKRWEPELGVVGEAQNDPVGFLTSQWERLTPELFVAAALVAGGLVEGLTVRGAYPNTDADIDTDPAAAVAGFAELQAKTWVALCMAWAQPDQRSSLELDLTRYLPPGALLPGSAELGRDMLASIGAAAQSQPLRYATHATRASVCAEAALDDPEAAAWARVWLELEVWRNLTEPAERFPLWDKLRIGADRAARTVHRRHLFDESARLFMEAGVDTLAALDAAGARASRPNLAADLVGALQPLEDKTLAAEEIIAAVQRSAAGGPLEAVLSGARKLFDLVAAPDYADTVWAGGDAISTWYGDTPEARARVTAWVGNLLNARYLPTAFLDRVGERPDETELRLPAHLRGHLAVERAAALHAATRFAAAIDIVDDALDLADRCPDEIDERMRRELRWRKARLRRDNGDREGALHELRRLAGEGNPADRLVVSRSLITSLLGLGRTDEALAALAQADRDAMAPSRTGQAWFRSIRAGILTVLGRHQDALDELMQVDEGALEDLDVLVPYASAWINILGAVGPDPAYGQRFMHMFDLLSAASDSTYESGALLVHETVLRLFAILATQLSDDDDDDDVDVDVLWEGLDVLCREQRGRADPMALIARAGSAARRGDPERVRHLLDEVFVAIAGEYGHSRELSVVVNLTIPLRWLLRRLIAEIMAAEFPLEYVRVGAELTRDLLGRLGPASEVVLAVVPWDANLAHLTISRPLAVIEAVSSGQTTKLLLTSMRAGTVGSTWLDQPPVDVPDLTERLAEKLRAWHSDRIGDPFDLADWSRFERWLTERIDSHCISDEDVTVIEDETIAGLPWHVALGPYWTPSYATSWAQQLTGMARQTPRPAHLGVVAVPRYREAAEVLVAFDTTVRGARRFAEHGLLVEVIEGVKADHAAVVRLLEACDAAVLLCHGQIAPDEHVVSWLLSHDGILPLKGSAEAATAHGRRHRLSWDDCDRLSHAPHHIFSAACSTGTAHYGGVGEQLGLFSALRRHGTRSMVAPRWDVPAADVLPLLDDVLTRVLVHGQPPASAVRETSREAAARLPRWLAWSFAAQGS